MIEYLEGRIDSLQPAAAVIDTGGIGYLVNISLNTYEALQGRERARVLVHESIREDAWVLYGFADEREAASAPARHAVCFRLTTQHDSRLSSPAAMPSN